MATVKIPGPAGVGYVAPAKDPGTRDATGADFGANVGDAMADLGTVAMNIGAKLEAKRRDAEDQVAADTYQLEFDKRAQEEFLDAQKTAPAGGAGFSQGLDTRLTAAKDDVLGKLRERGFNPSTKALAKIEHHAAERRRAYLVTGVTWEHNERVRQLKEQTDENVNAVAANTLATGNVDEGLARVDEILTGKEGLIAAEDLAPVRKAARQKVVESAIASLEGAGRFDEADAVKKRFFGSPPEKGGTNFEGALIHNESRGRPSLVNPFGYAGLYQFGAPRAADIGIYTPGPKEKLDGWSKTSADAPGKWSGTFNVPGFPEVKTLKDFLSNPEAQKAAYKLHTAKMDEEISRLGLDKYVGQEVGGVTITKDGLYGMIHLGGAEGAKRALASGGKDVVRDANGTSVMDYAKLASGSVKAEMPNPDRALFWTQRIAQRKTAALTKEASARSEEFERTIIDGAAGRQPMPNRSLIENDPVLPEDKRNTLLRQYDSAAKDAQLLQAGLAKFADPNAGPFNPFDTDEKKVVDKIYGALGGGLNSLQAVVDRTGMVPKAAGTDLRGALVSNDPNRVVGAATVARNMLARNPNIFAGLDDKEEIESAAVAFGHYVEHYGLSANEAAQRLIKEQSPEYKASVKARIKSEDVDKIIKDKLAVSDLTSAFNEGLPLLGRPSADFTPEARLVAMTDYAELFKERYLETGDVNAAKAQAVAQMKKVWGVTYVTGSMGGNIMRFPPEKAPAYAGIEKSSERIATQAIEAIKGASGQDIDRAKIMLTPTTGGQTARAYLSGQEVPYTLSWLDKSGKLQMLNPGKAFVPDAKAMRGALSEERRTGLERKAAKIVPPEDMSTMYGFGTTPREREGGVGMADY